MSDLQRKQRQKLAHVNSCTIVSVCIATKDPFRSLFQNKDVLHPWLGYLSTYAIDPFYTIVQSPPSQVKYQFSIEAWHLRALRSTPNCVMTKMTQLEKQAAEWCRLDKDGETRSVIQRLVDQSDEKELEARLGTSKSILPI